MKPFFSYYGSKYRLASRLGRPKYGHVIEPFAGSACFSTYWEPPKVTLVDLDPVVTGLWKYLKRASRQDIERLPGRVFHIDDLPTTACLKPMNKACHQLISSAPLEGTVVSLVKNEARL